MSWISVKESFPPTEDVEDGYDVLVCDLELKMNVALFDFDTKSFLGCEDVTHWMFLPEPPIVD